MTLLYQKELQKHDKTTSGEITEQQNATWELTLEQMNLAIFYFGKITDCKNSANLGLAKSLLMYVDIHLRLNANLKTNNELTQMLDEA